MHGGEKVQGKDLSLREERMKLHAVAAAFDPLSLHHDAAIPRALFE
jgi:hypothetical protein